MTNVSTADMLAELEEGDNHYLEVLSEESLSVELARYPNPEPKTPHKTDELYYVISGTGKAYVGNERYTIEEGDVLYVEQGTEHDFFDIESEITALIIFANNDESVLGRSH